MSIQKILSSIHASGLTDEQIGQRIGAPQSIVFRLRTGVHRGTSYERGLKIQALYESVQAKSSPPIPADVSTATSSAVFPHPAG